MARHHLGRVTLDRWNLVCERCGHEWKVTGEPPVACAKCRSKYWDIPRKRLTRGRPEEEDPVEGEDEEDG